MVIDKGGLSSLWVAPFPGQMALVRIRELAEQASKQGSFMVSASGSCLSSYSTPFNN